MSQQVKALVFYSSETAEAWLAQNELSKYPARTSGLFYPAGQAQGYITPNGHTQFYRFHQGQPNELIFSSSAPCFTVTFAFKNRSGKAMTHVYVGETDENHDSDIDAGELATMPGYDC